MSVIDKELIDWAERHIQEENRDVDVLTRRPDLSVLDAYRLRSELVKRRAAKGDGLLGYKVAGSAKSIQAGYHPEGPMIGSMLKSALLPASEPISCSSFTKRFVQAEVAVLMKRDLSGPDATMVDVYHAIEGFFPAIEYIALHTDPGKQSLQAKILNSKWGGGVILGPRMTLPYGIDLRLEGVVETVNGEFRGSATGVEALGNPLITVALIANTLAQIGESIKAGMILITGNFCPNVTVSAGDFVQFSFTRLGTVSARFVQ